MRSLMLAAAIVLTLTACASQTPAPEKAAAVAPAAAPAPAKPAPQCYSGDHGKFFDVGSKVAISGVNVVCEKSSDGKAAQWMGVKDKH